MATSNQANSLLIEHFRYTPLILLDDIVNVVNEIVFRAVGALEDGISAWPAQQLGFSLNKSQTAAVTDDDAKAEALDALKRDETTKGIVQLESLLNATVDNDFDKFEIYTLRNILAVGHEEEDLASWVRLDHYKGIDAVNAEDTPKPEDVLLQRRKLHETAKLNIMLKAEEARNAAVLEQLKTLVGSDESHKDADEAPAAFAFLNAATKTSHASNLTQDTQYVLDQLPALQRLLAQLKDTVKAVPGSRRHVEDEDTVDARRRKYLNSQSLRALERRGIDPDATAGASLTTGRKLGRDEVEGISKVVQALSADTQKSGEQSREDDAQMEGD